METMFSMKEKPSVDKMAEFLKTLSPKEQQEVNIFIQGIKFAKQERKLVTKESA